MNNSFRPSHRGGANIVPFKKAIIWYSSKIFILMIDHIIDIWKFSSYSISPQSDTLTIILVYYIKLFKYIQKMRNEELQYLLHKS